MKNVWLTNFWEKMPIYRKFKIFQRSGYSMKVYLSLFASKYNGMLKYNECDFEKNSKNKINIWLADLGWLK